MIIPKSTETRIASVDLSGYHAGQVIQHEAIVRARGHYYPAGQDAAGRPSYAWTPTHWQAEHATRASSDGAVSVARSPWLRSRAEAEAWLGARGLELGRAYWHAARPEREVRS